MRSSARQQSRPGRNEQRILLGHDVGILCEGVGALTEVHAGKHVVNMVMGGLISAHCQQQVPHLRPLAQLPILHRNIRSFLGGPLWVAALIDVLDGMPALFHLSSQMWAPGSSALLLKNSSFQRLCHIWATSTINIKILCNLTEYLQGFRWPGHPAQARLQLQTSVKSPRHA